MHQLQSGSRLAGGRLASERWQDASAVRDLGKFSCWPTAAGIVTRRSTFVLCASGTAAIARSPPQAFLLHAILEKPGLPPRELATELVISRPTVTRALDGLAGKGLVDRRASSGDGREQCIHPSASAVAIHAALNEASGRVTRRLKRLLGEELLSDTVGKVRSARSALQ